VSEVLDVDTERGWLLLADAGVPVRELGNRPEDWLVALPAYADLQRGEVEHVADHLADGVPDLRVEALPQRYHELLRTDLPLGDDERRRLSTFKPQFVARCRALADQGIPCSIQHDDLHQHNLFVREGRRRVLDWGDASISHPFASLVVTFRFLEEFNGLAPDDPWFARLRDAYLEPWGANLADTFALALLVGAYAHSLASVRQRDHLEEAQRAEFDKDFQVVLRRALEYQQYAEHP
jgi:Ser/Thr protein kinase RdoA (MazF antagonist)